MYNILAQTGKRIRTKLQLKRDLSIENKKNRKEHTWMSKPHGLAFPN